MSTGHGPGRLNTINNQEYEDLLRGIVERLSHVFEDVLITANGEVLASFEYIFVPGAEEWDFVPTSSNGGRIPGQDRIIRPWPNRWDAYDIDPATIATGYAMLRIHATGETFRVISMNNTTFETRGGRSLSVYDNGRSVGLGAYGRLLSFIEERIARAAGE